MRPALVLCLGLAVGGCTSKAWYEGMREAGRQQCRQTPDTDAAKDCTDRIDRQGYEAYKSERDKPASPVFR